MALTASMTTDPTTSVGIATITGDVGDDDPIVDLAETLSAIADGDHVGDHLIVDITGTEHLSTHRLDQLVDHTPERVIIVHATQTVRPRRVASSLAEARVLLDAQTVHQPQGGEPKCTS